MFGLIAYRTEETPPVQVIDGVRFRAVGVTRGESLRARLSARAAAGTLRQADVRYALFPADYPYAAPFARCGVVSPPLAPLYRAAAPAIVRRCMMQRGIEARHAMVAFAAERLTPELRRCVTALCRDIRYIALCIPDGGEGFARALLRDYGVAARVGRADALPRPDLFAVFDGTSVPGEALRLDEALDVAFDSPRPSALLALLHRAGRLDADTLQVKSLTRKPV